MYSVLIYELMPEETQIFLIPTDVITAEDLAMLKGSQARLINEDDENEHMLRLADILGGDWKKYLVADKKQPIYCPINAVYLSGVVL